MAHNSDVRKLHQAPRIDLCQGGFQTEAMLARTRRFICCFAVVVATMAASGTTAAHADPPASAPVTDADGTLTHGWKVQSSAVASGTGATISGPAHGHAGVPPISP